MCLYTALTFSFRASAYSFMENIGTGTVYVDKINGSTGVDITLRVFGCKLDGVFNDAVEYFLSQSFNIPVVCQFQG